MCERSCVTVKSERHVLWYVHDSSPELQDVQASYTVTVTVGYDVLKCCGQARLLA